ncbi:Spx/MgsR family RNA polymerase-binding regulatory protein [Lyngbya confervoides]|uniref:Spx/MgsR family RNA polymerase-binding regulatory protein n=1 Tax=Lyngbya confervoides BDU141951 TaxID=1574623 RepID=A0ABD4T5X6_9CYAN|nr:Spx/MgsR family RNA polymerase-binding regulatory protein [Lyngbya confervoides]MCM1984061.1 Spx/MgsR family RNA polymerase-binding regulatory protein [Lyngbya confervoides BDU141951]
MQLQVYGIPTCGTCKKAVSWLDARQVNYEFINTKENPPEEKRIAEWIQALGSQPMRNTSGKSYRSLGEEKKVWSDEQWLEAFSQDAMLIRRPLFVRDGQAVLVGFRGSDAAIAAALGLSH